MPANRNKAERRLCAAFRAHLNGEAEENRRTARVGVTGGPVGFHVNRVGSVGPKRRANAGQKGGAMAYAPPVHPIQHCIAFPVAAGDSRDSSGRIHEGGRFRPRAGPPAVS